MRTRCVVVHRVPSKRPAATAPTTPPPDPASSDRLELGYVGVRLDRTAGSATIEISGPAEIPVNLAELRRLGADFWLLSMVRQLDQATSWLRADEPDVRVWRFRTRGNMHGVRMCESLVLGTDDRLTSKIRDHAGHLLRRIESSGRRRIALIEPESCYAGVLFELALACDRRLMSGGTDERDRSSAIVLTDANFGAFPGRDGLPRLARVAGAEQAGRLRRQSEQALTAPQAAALGLVTEVGGTPGVA